MKEIDLTRKLSESYDMQEKLVADNADLEVKRSDMPYSVVVIWKIIFFITKLRIPNKYIVMSYTY